MSDSLIRLDAKRPPVRREAYRPAEVAEAFGLSEAYVRRSLAAGHLRGHKVGRAWVVLRDDVETWIRGDRQAA